MNLFVDRTNSKFFVALVDDRMVLDSKILSRECKYDCALLHTRRLSSAGHEPVILCGGNKLQHLRFLSVMARNVHCCVATAETEKSHQVCACVSRDRMHCHRCFLCFSLI